MTKDNERFVGPPGKCHSLEEIIGVIRQVNPPRVVVIFEQTDADMGLTMLSTDMTFGDANWLLDRAKYLLHRDVDAVYY
jgi:hypothetical protein